MIHLWLLSLAVWEETEHSSALFTPKSRIVVERVDIWVFSFAIHTLLFRKKATPPPDPRLQPESCLLLQPTPTRGGQKARVSSRTNTYILVDSGLRVRSPQIKDFAFKILLRVCKGKYSGYIVVVAQPLALASLCILLPQWCLFKSYMKSAQPVEIFGWAMA